MFSNKFFEKDLIKSQIIVNELSIELILLDKSQ